ncbi:MAG: hypothetical protein UU65_C0002G0284 [candidate division CPR2 bacterium GW2011_GWC1_41_48]|uniref:Uncharacterized protein n=1 Tax=candidate division CPR2 bacterium GW2011_GWC1_41_48 TaxID=1618344 RepID=A0A0G0YIX9_UNCC2|nr:MAG: hypothetical protein UT47_C0002G0020 [candidate division CPR2 bacterium GW2011_GWC2_39_35]KKR26964.1 MAG: hypothetical protein UT59_C0074G0001 [candidate division CPR2 bacterium GW2011_GWD1_39_7]KKR29010.1 MAG: hypothetical protein UT60_C0008G0053 [candidate division CPR2 bacterium GW2011_GWD2_39_7]KKS09506.1 MAG: hypothetical protein UU65_C0002G0284 [candidate division CPR2 bacterium GW2011_GWC1_41_48]OGB56515.1 MAG: hypothetical protein A2Y27_01530 [candidate division CPR2 bacterium G
MNTCFTLLQPIQEIQGETKGGHIVVDSPVSARLFPRKSLSLEHSDIAGITSAIISFDGDYCLTTSEVTAMIRSQIEGLSLTIPVVARCGNCLHVIPVSYLETSGQSICPHCPTVFLDEIKVLVHPSAGEVGKLVKEVFENASTIQVLIPKKTKA